MFKENLAEDPMDRLANAIVVQAADDYRAALRANNKEAMNEALRIEKFFRSGWYSSLTSIDGEYLINRLREDIDHG